VWQSAQKDLWWQIRRRVVVCRIKPWLGDESPAVIEAAKAFMVPFADPRGLEQLPDMASSSGWDAGRLKRLELGRRRMAEYQPAIARKVNMFADRLISSLLFPCHVVVRRISPSPRLVLRILAITQVAGNGESGRQVVTKRARPFPGTILILHRSLNR